MIHCQCNLTCNGVVCISDLESVSEQSQSSVLYETTITHTSPREAPLPISQFAYEFPDSWISMKDLGK